MINNGNYGSKLSAAAVLLLASTVAFAAPGGRSAGYGARYSASADRGNVSHANITSSGGRSNSTTGSGKGTMTGSGKSTWTNGAGKDTWTRGGGWVGNVHITRRPPQGGFVDGRIVHGHVIREPWIHHPRVIVDRWPVPVEPEYPWVEDAVPVPVAYPVATRVAVPVAVPMAAPVYPVANACGCAAPLGVYR